LKALHFRDELGTFQPSPAALFFAGGYDMDKENESGKYRGRVLIGVDKDGKITNCERVPVMKP